MTITQSIAMALVVCITMMLLILIIQTTFFTHEYKYLIRFEEGARYTNTFERLDNGCILVDTIGADYFGGNTYPDNKIVICKENYWIYDGVDTNKAINL